MRNLYGHVGRDGCDALEVLFLVGVGDSASQVLVLLIKPMRHSGV